MERKPGVRLLYVYVEALGAVKLCGRGRGRQSPKAVAELDKLSKNKE